MKRQWLSQGAMQSFKNNMLLTNKPEKVEISISSMRDGDGKDRNPMRKLHHDENQIAPLQMA
jgi:hypothetical protein